MKFWDLLKAYVDSRILDGKFKTDKNTQNLAQTPYSNPIPWPGKSEIKCWSGPQLLVNL